MRDHLTHYNSATPVAVVQKASWPDEKIVCGTLDNIASKVAESDIKKTAMLMEGDVLGTKNITPSKL